MICINSKIYILGKEFLFQVRENILNSISNKTNPHNFSFYPCKILASKNCYLIGNGRVTLRPHIQTNDEVKKGLWIFQSIDNISRNDNSSQERILITDICRGHNYPKQFTTYQIVSANDENICLGVQFPPDFMQEQKCLRVLPCYKSKGIRYTIFS